MVKTYLQVILSIVIIGMSMAVFSPWTQYSDINSTEQWRLGREFNSIESSWSLKHNFPTAKGSASYYLLTETIEFSEITLTSAKHDFSQAKITLDKSNSQIIEGDKIFNFVFSFKYKYSYLSSGEGTGTATGTASQYKLTKSWEKLSNVPQVDVAIEIKEAAIVLHGKYESDAEVKRLSTVTVDNYLAKTINVDLSNTIRDQVNAWFQNLSKSQVYQISTFYPQVDVSVDITPNAPVKNLERGVIYYNNLNLNIQPMMQDGPETWDKFDESAPHQIFLHQSFFQKVANQLIKDNRFVFTLTEKNRPTAITTQLNIASLAKFYSDILNDHAPDEALKVRINVTQFVIGSIQDLQIPVTATYSLTFLDSSDIEVFQATVSGPLRLKGQVGPGTTKGTISFNLSLSRTTSDSLSIIVPAKYTGYDYNKLVSLINNETFNYLNTNAYVLFKDGLPLGLDDYTGTYLVAGNGILVKGSNHEERKQQVEQKLLKFLN